MRLDPYEFWIVRPRYTLFRCGLPRLRPLKCEPPLISVVKLEVTGVSLKSNVKTTIDTPHLEASPSITA